MGFGDARKGTAGTVRHGELWLVLFRQCEAKYGRQGEMMQGTVWRDQAWMVIIKEAKGKNNERIQMENRIL